MKYSLINAPRRRKHGKPKWSRRRYIRARMVMPRFCDAPAAAIKWARTVGSPSGRTSLRQAATMRRCRICTNDSDTDTSTEEQENAESHPLPMVRRTGGRGGEFLRLDLQEFQDRPDPALGQGGPGKTRQRTLGDVRTRRTDVPGSERRAGIPLHRGDLAVHRLQGPERGRLFLG